MNVQAILANEDERLAALYRYRILDTLPEADYDDIVELAAQICHASIAWIALTDRDRQWFKAKVGIEFSEIPRETSLCEQVIVDAAPVIIADVSRDRRFANHPFIIANPHIRFYAGVPLITPDHHILGTLCVLDQQPKHLLPQPIKQLECLSRLIINQLELRRKNQKAQLLVDIIHFTDDAVVSKTLDGIITSWNPAATELFGYAESDVIGQPITILFPPDRVAEETQILEAIKHGQRINHFNTVRLHKDGTPVDVSVTISPLRDHKGQVVGAAKIMRNLKLQKQLDEVTRALHQTEIVALTDTQGTITFVNDKFCEISQYSREELLGQNHRLLNSGYHPREFFAQMWQTIARGQIWRGEIRNRAKDGSFYWVDTKIVPFLNAQGKPIQYLAIRSDTTIRKAFEEKLQHEIVERQQAQEQLQRLTEQLIASNRELQDFAYVSSHDLQEPLRKIQAFGDRLKSHYHDALDDRGRDYLERMLNAASRAQILINDLLAFSRVTTKAKPFQPTDLSDVLAGVLLDLEVRIEQTQATITADPLPTVAADPLQMRQLFQNLIGNALKFSKLDVPPTVHVQSRCYVRSDRQWCEIQIIDHGIGFEQKYADRIFQIFQRLHTRSEYEGTGIGLAICQKIVHRHGGQLRAESELGQGASFILTLPIHPTEGEHDV